MPARSSRRWRGRAGHAGRAWAAWLDTLRQRDASARPRSTRRPPSPGEYVNPLAFFRALEAEAGDNAVFVADGGDFVATASYVLHPRTPLSWLDPGAFGTLGVGAGFAHRARRWPGPAARSGSSGATAPAAGAWPSSTASCARASR